MRSIENFEQANQILATFIQRAGTYELERMRNLMSFLGNPQDSIRVIHVAGTSGKTSTSYYTAALLKAAGHTVGLSVSPHIDEVNERVQINMTPLSEDSFCHELSLFLDLIDKSTIIPSYFELLVAFAYWTFHKLQVDYAVIEVGLGGLLDGTNVINRSDKICIITDIGLDHVQILGDTLPLITAQKAGIIQEKNAVFMHDQGQQVMPVIQKVSTKKHADLHIVIPASSTIERIKLLPLFQQRNIQLAADTVRWALARDYQSVLTEANFIEAAGTYIPGRMEIYSYKNRSLVLDGSHNEQKIGALVAAMAERFPDTSIPLLVSFGLNKEPSVLASLRLLRTLGTRIIITEFHTYQDETRIAITATQLAVLAARVGFEHISIEPDPAKALELLLETDAHVGLITGSFYLLNHYRFLIRPKV